MSHETLAISPFETAVEALVAGDVATLRQLLAAHPGLVRERSGREHRSTLLHYVSANGVEQERQKTPSNIVEITTLLLDAGAEVDAQSEAYGGGCTALGLAATSIHPEKAGVQLALLETLLARGASLELKSGGNGHGIVHGCLANGQPAAARFLAERGAPLDMEGAAALGRLDLLAGYFGADGALRPGVDARQAQAALRYASGYGSLEATRLLLEHGVDPASPDETNQTALHWACWGPELGAVELLIGAGAPIDARDTQFHATPLDTALWTWRQAESDEVRARCRMAVAALARVGAKLDPGQWHDADGRSEMLERIEADPEMRAALGGAFPTG